MTEEERFWSYVNKTGNCWEWTGGKRTNGYGQFCLKSGKNALAHRYSYEKVKGTIPVGLTIDHLCRNRACVNPEHLEAVTLWENTKRGKNPLAKFAVATHCKHGHLLSGVNLKIRSNGHRICRECIRTRGIGYKRKARRVAADENRRLREVAMLAHKRQMEPVLREQLAAIDRRDHEWKARVRPLTHLNLMTPQEYADAQGGWRQ